MKRATLERTKAGRNQVMQWPVGALIAGLVLAGAACQRSGPTAGSSDEGEFSQEGDRAPDFTLPSAVGPDVSLPDYRGERPVLLYFSMGPG